MPAHFPRGPDESAAASASPLRTPAVRAHPGILGDAALVRAFADARVRLVRYRAGQEMRAHAHDWTGVTLVVAGCFQDVLAERTAMCLPLTLVVKPEGVAHATRVGADGALTVHLELSPAAVGALRSRGVDTGRCSYLLAGSSTADLLGSLARGDAEGSRIAETIAGILLRRTHAPDPTGASSGAGRCTRDAARSAGMHPVAFARRFRRDIGMSPSRWRLHRRVVHAAGALAGGAQRLAAVAQAAGFADQAHLCRMFKRETGLTPGRYRALVGALATRGM